MVLMADEDDTIPFARELDGFQMHFCNKRAGGVDDLQAPFFCLAANGGRNPVGAEDGAGARGDFVQFLHEDGARIAQLVHYVLVMHDFLADINGRPVKVQSDLDYVDGAHYASAEAARLEKKDFPLDT